MRLLVGGFLLGLLVVALIVITRFAFLAYLLFGGMAMALLTGIGVGILALISWCLTWSEKRQRPWTDQKWAR